MSCLEVKTNGTTKEASPPQPAETRAVEKETPVQQVQPQPPPPPPERSNEKEKEKTDKDKSGGEFKITHLRCTEHQQGKSDTFSNNIHTILCTGYTS